RNKGRRGAVIQVLADGRVVVESVNMVKKHQKPNPQAGKQGGIIEKEMPLPVSKVAIWNPGAKKGDRIGIKTLGDGKRVRFTKSRKAIASFKLRAGLAVGAKVTLRGTRMYEFLDRLINIAMPRIRDFRGVSPRAFDGQGNYTLGVKEQIIFPEIQYDQVDQVRGMDITITTTARDDRHGRAL